MGSAHGNPGVGAGSTPRKVSTMFPVCTLTRRRWRGRKRRQGQDAGGTPALPGPMQSIHGLHNKPQTWLTRLVFFNRRRAKHISSIRNIDGQDERDERFRQEKLARSPIRRVNGCPGFTLADARLLKTGILYILSMDVNNPWSNDAQRMRAVRRTLPRRSLISQGIQSKSSPVASHECER